MNENINLCKILKDCPLGMELWSPLAGVVVFDGVYEDKVNIILSDNTELYVNHDGRMEIRGISFIPFISQEIMLYPSKDQRDWSKWKCPKPEKSKFDPKTLNAFDKVLGLMMSSDIWRLGFFSHKKDNEPYYNIVGGNIFHTILPFNSDTEYLVGTSDKAPEYYRYWED